jgi:cytochrome P450
MLWRIIRDPLGSLQAIHREYGDIAEFHFGNRRVLVLGHPELVREALVTKQSSFVKSRTMRMGKQLMGEGLPATEGTFHRNQRKVIQPSFSHKRIDAHLQTIWDYATNAADGWRDGDRLKIREEMMKLTLSMTVKVLFGTDIRRDSAKVRRALTESLGHFVSRYYLRILYYDQDRNPFVDLLESAPTPGNVRYRRSMDLLEDTVDKIIESRVEGASGGCDLLDDLLAASGYMGEEKLGPRQLRDELMTFLLAGHDTTATALTWSFYLLANNPSAESKLQQEVDQISGRSPMEFADLKKFKYADKVVTEAIRLYPPAWMIGREAVKECSIGGTRVAVGTTVLMSQYLLHRDARFFDSPGKFNPDRWTPEMESKLPSFAYFPFGGGLRGCVGAPLAKAMAILTLAAFASRWRLRLAPGQTVTPQPRITLHPKNDIIIVPERRK